MTHISRTKALRLLPCGSLLLALALAGCDREQIKVQQVPKDSSQSAQAQAMPQTMGGQGMADPHAGMNMGAAPAQPQLKYTLPTGWKEKALSSDGMRVASFDAPGKDGQVADVSVIPLPTMPPETELANLNMWRDSIQLPKADKAESTPVTIGSSQGKLYDVGGEKATGRILVAVLDRDGMSWYFKMKGDDATVRDQKAAFLDFVKSVSFESAPATTASAAPLLSTSMAQGDAAPAAADSGVPLPAGWKALPPSQFLLAKYEIQGSGDAKAEVNVSALAGTGGGVLPNVTRWRNQLQLSPISEDDLSKQASTVDVAGGKGTLVDMTGTDAKTGKPARLIGIIAPQADQTWFYKLMGDPQIVEQQKDAFTKFIQSAKFSNAL